MIYTVGQPAITSSQYSFTQSPNCGYEETLSITGVPSQVDHDLTNRDFTVRQTFDDADAGAYVVSVRSSFQVPTDATESSFQNFEVSYDFTIFIEPCAVNSYDVSLSVGVLTQAFSAPS